MPKDTKNPIAPDQPIPDDNVAVNDRKASKGSEYAGENNASAEGNDSSLTHGPTRTREVPQER